MQEIEQKTEPQKGKDKPSEERKWGAGRIICVTLLALLLLLIMAVAAVIIWLGPIVEKYVERNDMELIGRNIEMDNLSVKLFDGILSVDNLVLYEEVDDAEFVRISHLDTQMDVMAIFDNTIHISHLNVQQPSVSVIQGAEEFNFDTLITYILETYVGDEVKEATGEPWSVVLENIAVDQGAVLYRDVELDQEWRLSALALSTPNLYLDDNPTLIATSATINEAGSLNGNLQINCSTLDFMFDGVLQDFNIADTYKYIKPTVNMQSLEGLVSADCTIDGNVLDIMSMNIVGDIGVANFELLGPDGGNVFSTSSLQMSVERLNINDQVYHFNSIVADGYSTQLCIAKDGSTNFDQLFYGEPEISVETSSEALGDDMYDVRERVTITTSETEEPFAEFDLRIGTLDLKGGNVRYADNTMHEPFDYTVRSLSIRSRNVTLSDKNRITIRAQLPKQGTAMMQWEGSLDDFYNQSLLVMLSNVDIQSLSTYVEYYTAFPVTSGNLTLRSQNVVTNGELSGINQLGTYNFNVGDKDKSLDAEYKLPVKLGIYVLTDREKHIDVELPISGNISSPEFSLRKVIWKAIGNVMLKVAASPFEWMAKDKQDAFRHIDIDLMAAGLDSESYARIDTMVNTLKGDTTLAVRLKPRVNYNRAVRTLADLNLKMAYYNATEGRERGFLDMLDFARIADMKLSGEGIRNYADSVLLTRGVDPTGMSTHAKAVTLYGDMIDQQILSVINVRNGVIARYVSFQHSDLPQGKFVLEPLTIEDIKGYKGKDRYTVTLIVGDQEVEVVAEEDEAEDAQDPDEAEDGESVEDPEPDAVAIEPIVESAVVEDGDADSDLETSEI